MTGTPSLLPVTRLPDLTRELSQTHPTMRAMRHSHALLRGVRQSLSVRCFTTTATNPPSIGTRVLNYAFDHPWRSLSPFVVALALYLLRSAVSTSNQEALVRALDQCSPLHLREVAALGKANALTCAEWRAVVVDVLAAVDARAQRLRKSRDDVPLDAAAYDELAKVRPSEVEAAIVAAMSRRGERRELVHVHLLRRACAWLAMREAGVVESPVSDAEAHAILGARALEDAHAAGLSETQPDTFVETIVAAGKFLLRALGLLPPSEPPPHAAHVFPALSNVRYEDYSDHPLPVALVLSLYGSNLGARGEFDRSDDENDPSNLPKPSQRLMLWVDLMRDVSSLRERHAAGSVSVRDDVRSWEAARSVASSVLAAGAIDVREAGLGEQMSCAPAITLDEAAAVAALLGDTFQLPTRTRTGAFELWPVPRYGLRGAADTVQAATAEVSVDFTKTPVPEKPPPPIDGATPVPQIPAAALPVAKTPRRWLSANEARSVLLTSRQTCSWSECNANQPEYKGGLF